MIFTDLEKVKIETFCQDEEMFNAVKKGLLYIMYNEGVVSEGEVSVRNSAFNLIANVYAKDEVVSNEALGERLRALYEGVDAVENALAQLQKVTTKVESPYVKEENKSI
jgi:hypothetical protein